MKKLSGGMIVPENEMEKAMVNAWNSLENDAFNIPPLTGEKLAHAQGVLVNTLLNMNGTYNYRTGMSSYEPRELKNPIEFLMDSTLDLKNLAATSDIKTLRESYPTNQGFIPKLDDYKAADDALHAARIRALLTGSGMPKKWIQDVVGSPKFKKGAFTKQALKEQETPLEFAKDVLAHPEHFSLKTRRRAQFLQNIQRHKDQHKLHGGESRGPMGEIIGKPNTRESYPGWEWWFDFSDWLQDKAPWVAEHGWEMLDMAGSPGGFGPGGHYKPATGPLKPKKGKGTHKEDVVQHYGLPESNSLKALSDATSVPVSTLQQVYNRGIGAYKTNPSSVRMKGSYAKGVDAPMSQKLSKEQWAMARVYSFIDQNPKHDNDLRGGMDEEEEWEYEPVDPAIDVFLQERFGRNDAIEIPENARDVQGFPLHHNRRYMVIREFNAERQAYDTVVFYPTLINIQEFLRNALEHPNAQRCVEYFWFVDPQMPHHPHPPPPPEPHPPLEDIALAFEELELGEEEMDTDETEGEGRMRGGVSIPKKEFVKEHKKLVNVLVKGTPRQRKKEASDQLSELVKMLGV